MHGAALPGWLLTVLCAATGAYCLVRMRSCPGPAGAAAGGEALMGFGMAAMAVPSAVFTLPRWHWVAYAAVYGAAAVRAVRPLPHGGHHVHHLVGCLAMVYMAVATASGGGHGEHTAGGGVPPLTGALLLYFAVYVLRSGTRLVPMVAGGGTVGVQASAGPRPIAAGGGSVGVRASPGPPSAPPELVPACRVSMAIAMLAMLLTL